MDHYRTLSNFIDKIVTKHPLPFKTYLKIKHL